MTHAQLAGTAVIFAVVLATGFIEHENVTVAQAAAQEQRHINGCPLFNKAGHALAMTIVVKVHYDDNGPHDCIYRSKT